MFANTKQVRSVLKGFGINANYTEKTTVKESTTRVVMATVYLQSSTFTQLVNDVQRKFTELGYTNKVYSTQECYLRIKTLMA